jgi:hypothetical protein
VGETYKRILARKGSRKGVVREVGGKLSYYYSFTKSKGRESFQKEGLLNMYFSHAVVGNQVFSFLQGLLPG